MVPVSLLAAAGLALQAAPGAPVAFTQKGGESGRSADARWRIYSKAPEKPGAPQGDSRGIASLWLQGIGVPEKRLTTYQREGTLYWLGDRRHAVFVHRQPHLQEARFFTLTGEAAAQKSIDLAIAGSMAATAPKLGTVENRLLTPKTLPGGALCLTVEESGLPPGKSQGSFVVRKGIFRVSATGKTMRVPSCSAGTTQID